MMPMTRLKVRRGVYSGRDSRHLVLCYGDLVKCDSDRLDQFFQKKTKAKRGVLRFRAKGVVAGDEKSSGVVLEFWKTPLIYVPNERSHGAATEVTFLFRAECKCNQVHSQALDCMLLSLEALSCEAYRCPTLKTKKLRSCTSLCGCPWQASQ